MAKIKTIPLAALFTIMLASCPIFPPDEDFGFLEENSFYVQNIAAGTYYKVKAEILYEGEKCVIWAEKGSGVTTTQATDFANKFDTVIRPRVVERFSRKNFTYRSNNREYSFDNMLDFANWLAGRNNKKLTILLLDIKDGFKNPQTDSYVAGYFFNGNFYPKGKISGTSHYSNGRDMIYVDTNPGLKNPSQAYTTFAHELQHLVNYVTSVQLNRRSTMDIWIDEGLSSQAEYFYLNENPKDKCEWFSQDREGTIARGNNFFVWDNHSEKSSAIMDDYATVYLFFRWLYLRADTGLQPDIFYNIITSADYDYRAVINAAKQINPAWNNWENLLRTWLAANYYPGNAIYGYRGDNYLHGKIKVKPVAGSSISLYPGEGVYSIINGSYTPSAVGDPNIRYAGLDNTGDINTSSPYGGNVLLTFNANTSKTSSPETGSLTGVSSITSFRTAAEDTQTKQITGPYVIDARDALKRAGR